VERGVRNPTVIVLEVLARGLGIKASQLLEEVEPVAIDDREKAERRA
jgi:hypothetical protein